MDSQENMFAKTYSAVELSNAFDILYNNINSNKSPGIDEYEKSYFFTKAQDELIKRYAFAHTNAVGAGIDGSQKRQIDYSTLVTTAELSRNTDANLGDKYSVDSVDSYIFPEDVLFILNESVYANASQTNIRERKERQVIPITFDQYSLLRQKPYPFPPKRQVWRLLRYYEDKVISEIITPESIDTYLIRYIKYPSPIVLEDWDEEDGRTIRGVNKVTLPILPIQLQEELIQAAVEIAKQAYNSMAPGDIMRFPENQIAGR